IAYTQEQRNNNLQSIHIQPILPNPYQPTQLFHPNNIKQLPQSIQHHRLLHPILLPPVQQHMFQIIPPEPPFPPLHSFHKPQLHLILPHIHH
ncbi:ParB N-terminal domain-containing protein, partial [Staphylococcus epidermidis]|uniref:ParB N-terminal domain-containing protein n=1 Tax=Staphylococcus epidermidis TaxID=1282 RepID=UPI0016430842